MGASGIEAGLHRQDEAREASISDLPSGRSREVPAELRKTMVQGMKLLW